MKEKIEIWFGDYGVSDDDLNKLDALREAAKVFALKIDELCPNSADKTAAIRQLRESLSTAMESIVRGGQ